MAYSQTNSDYWQPGARPGQQDFYNNPEMEYSAMQSQKLDFQNFNDENSTYYNNTTSKSYMEPYQQSQYPEMFTPMASDFNQDQDEDEPPLLEELEIYPDRIMEKTLAVLNPFRTHSLADDAEFLCKQTDLAGPITFCLVLACCLFISGSKAHFGYIYGLSVTSCLLMYALLTLMTAAADCFTLASVASILGYCLLPIVGLSVIGIFVSLHSSIGIIIAICAVLWSSLSASRLFVAMSGDAEQRPLIAYPCALVSGVFALLIIF
ncbi:protein YIPF7-like [Atheta coriaria]|uniref:protein YIPF7-like n=1 Tax=Dalotia coriaria TaxID=877792 RepID=UPI0031F3F530